MSAIRSCLLLLSVGTFTLTELQCLLGKVRGGVTFRKADSQLGLHARRGHLQHPCGWVHAVLNGGHTLHTLQIMSPQSNQY